MKIVRKIFYLMFLYSALGFTACSDEEKKIDWNGVEITNTELKNVLQQKGFTFNAAGNLVQDNKVKNTTKLDLSNCNLSDVSGLNAFSNLKEVNLSHNKFQKSFDFSKLPLSVTGVDLTGNEIYEYPGLVNIVTEENGDEKVTVLYNLRKLYLPESAKYNCVELPTFYSKNSGVDMQMEDKLGNLLAYTTLREVPDEKLRTYLKETFPSMFEGNVINIAKRMIKEASNNIVINQWLNNEDIEGVEYIIMNPSYKGGAIALRVKEAATLPYLKIPSYIYKVILSKVTTNYVNFTEATNICLLYWDNDKNITQIDLSKSILGQRGYKNEFNGSDTPSDINIHDCSNLEKISLPAKAEYLGNLVLYNLPLLGDELNLSQYKDMMQLQLGRLPKIRQIVYFTPDGTVRDKMNSKMFFGISTDVYEQHKKETKAFLDTYHGQFTQSYFFPDTGLNTYTWKNDYK